MCITNSDLHGCVVNVKANTQEVVHHANLLAVGVVSLCWAACHRSLQTGQPFSWSRGLPHAVVSTVHVKFGSSELTHIITELWPVFLLISSLWLSGGMSKKRGRYVETKLPFIPSHYAIMVVLECNVTVKYNVTNSCITKWLIQVYNSGNNYLKSDLHLERNIAFWLK